MISLREMLSRKRHPLMPVVAVVVVVVVVVVDFDPVVLLDSGRACDYSVADGGLWKGKACT